jgi:ComF family protein
VGAKSAVCRREVAATPVRIARDGIAKAAPSRSSGMRALIDLLLPPRCPGCGREGVLLCSRCRAVLDRRLDEPPGVPLGMPASMPDGLLQLEWCAAYSGPVRQALHALKYTGDRRLAGPLGRALAERWRRAGRGGDTVTWVPVHPARRRDRGFDQAEELACVMAAALRLPLLASLERRRRTAAQHALGRDDRASNVGGVFGTMPSERVRIAGRWFVVVDDILTTGATLSDCARGLLDAGAAGVSAIVVARER